MSTNIIVVGDSGAGKSALCNTVILPPNALTICLTKICRLAKLQVS